MMLFNRDRDRPWKFGLTTILFLIVAFYIKTSNAFAEFIDSSIVDVIQKNQPGWKTLLYRGVTILAEPKLAIIWVLVLGFLLWGFKFKIPALWCLATLGGGDVLATLVKHVVKRARPSSHLAIDDGYSFPSGHVFGTFLLVAMIWLILVPMLMHTWQAWLLRLILLFWMALVMISRVYLNAHFPTDTLGAVMLGYLWLQFTEGLYIRLAPAMQHWPLLKHSEI
ncbi:membrane-associated phospholipid phosphatase [Levilactobacillus senmaizukei DSM 21775 = NBRC 103853]|uniref:Membrane-associated phospholipid phosphatase n=2 Tax=Levilactobacillus senmaizukei TaxID=431273 RepID=A0A0R2DT21_9LACO|nr:phosphatase PAP2 family protein [Levilactobacillus senmaizukei]KRN03156.1 membrane-associated phospholipid phosphatase [Levilactobacillus senmaizukei DSM 21775 = NBRC 103853]